MTMKALDCYEARDRSFRKASEYLAPGHTSLIHQHSMFPGNVTMSTLHCPTYRTTAFSSTVFLSSGIWALDFLDGLSLAAIRHKWISALFPIFH